MDENKDYNPDIVTVEDEEGVEHTFEIADAIETDDARYVALIPVYDNPEDILSGDGELIILEVLEENGNKCFFNDEHDSFLSYSEPGPVEGHYIIPLSLHDSFSESLDCKENLIALCPHCLNAMTYATNDFKEVLLKLILEKLMLWEV